MVQEQDRVILTMEYQYKVAYGLSNGAIFNDLERPITWFPRSRHSLTLNITGSAVALYCVKANRQSQ